MSDQQSIKVDTSDFRDLRFEPIPDEGLELFGDLVGILFHNQREKEFLGDLHVQIVSNKPGILPEVYIERNGNNTPFQYFGYLEASKLNNVHLTIEKLDILAFVSQDKSNRYVFITVSQGKSYILAAYSPMYPAFNCTPATEMRKLFEAFIKVIPGKLERLYWLSQY